MAAVGRSFQRPGRRPMASAIHWPTPTSAGPAATPTRATAATCARPTGVRPFGGRLVVTHSRRAATPLAVSPACPPPAHCHPPCPSLVIATPGHCDCINCRDFSRDDNAVRAARSAAGNAGGADSQLNSKLEALAEAGAEQAAAAAAQAAPANAAVGNIAKAADPANSAAKKTALPRFRSDGRCGPNFPAPGAPSFGECDPKSDADQKGPCCNPESGWCGNIRQVDWGTLRVQGARMARVATLCGLRPLTCLFLLHPSLSLSPPPPQVTVTARLVSTTVGAACFQWLGVCRRAWFVS